MTNLFSNITRILRNTVTVSHNIELDFCLLKQSKQQISEV